MSEKIYWFVKEQDDKFCYKFDTYENIGIDYSIGDEAIVVHPDNEIFEDEYRSYNKSYIDSFNKMHEIRVKRLIEMKAPNMVIEHEKKYGPFTKEANLLKKQY